MSKRRWKTPRERTPEVGRTVLGWYGEGVGHLAVERADDGNCYDDTGGEWRAPLLWTKIPELPESAGGGS